MKLAVYDTSGLIGLGYYGLESKDPSILNGIGKSGYIMGESEDWSLQWMEQEF